MRLLRLALALALTGCGSPSSRTGPLTPGAADEPDLAARPDAAPAPAAPAPVYPPVPARFADTDLVAFEGDELAFYALAHGGGPVVELGRVRFPEDAELRRFDGDWADRDNLIVSIGPPDRPTVVRISAAGITGLAVPEPSFFQADRPPGDDVGPGGGEGGLIVTPGEAWWAECPWGVPYDGGICEVWVHARLWPSKDRSVDSGRIRGRAWSWPKPAPAPTGYQLKEIDDGKSLLCTSPAAKRVRPVRIQPQGEVEVVMTQRWVSVEPPRLLVVFAEPGFADLIPDRWTLHDGCHPTAIATGAWVEPGPGALWAADQVEAGDDDDKRPSQLVIREGAAVHGALGPQATIVRFRPPAP